MIKGPGPFIAKVSPPVHIEFTGASESDILKGTPLLDNIRILGRDCEWALKVDKSKMSSCIEFMGKLQPGGEFKQINDRMLEIMGDKKVAAENIDEFKSQIRHMKEIVKYKEFMLANLGVH
jgi:hypothetical protein